MMVIISRWKYMQDPCSRQQRDVHITTEPHRKEGRGEIGFNAKPTMMVISEWNAWPIPTVDNRHIHMTEPCMKEGRNNDRYIKIKCMMVQDPKKPCGQQERDVHIWNVHSRINKCVCVCVLPLIFLSVFGWKINGWFQICVRHKPGPT